LTDITITVIYWNSGVLRPTETICNFFYILLPLNLLHFKQKQVWNSTWEFLSFSHNTCMYKLCNVVSVSVAASTLEREWRRHLAACWWPYTSATYVSETVWVYNYTASTDMAISVFVPELWVLNSSIPFGSPICMKSSVMRNNYSVISSAVSIVKKCLTGRLFVLLVNRGVIEELIVS
jgi:hypothetical protein